MMDNRRPLILDIKGNSLDDGPGIRTVVFFKGCPLSCVWCHNPESKRSGPEISYDPKDCVGCDTCLTVCPERALDRDNLTFINRERCTLCYECVEDCPSGALARVGRYMEVEEVAAEVEKDLPFFETSGGGVTLSGGEPTLFMNYTRDLLARLKKVGVNIIVETCGLFDMGEFEMKILPLVDAVYFDLKILDEWEHQEQCGSSNEVVLRNFRRLISLEEGPEVLPRIPLIPGITATDENLSAIAGFLRDNDVTRVAILQYNPLWVEKSRKIGGAEPDRKGEWTSWMDLEDIRHCRSLFEDFEIV